jgi:hypothetical protein
VNPEYIPDNFFDYKEYELFNNKHYRYTLITNPDAAQTVWENGSCWDCKYHSLPYYTPEEIAEKFGNQN